MSSVPFVDFQVTLWTTVTLGLVPSNDHVERPALRRGPHTAAIPACRVALGTMDSAAIAQRTQRVEMDDSDVHEIEASGDPTEPKKKRPLDTHEDEDDTNPNDLWKVWHSRRKQRELKRTANEDPTATEDRASLPRFHVLMHTLNGFPVAKIPGQTVGFSHPYCN